MYTKVLRRFFNPREEIRLISLFAYVDRLSDGEAVGISLEPKIYGQSALNSPKTAPLAQVNEC